MSETRHFGSWWLGALAFLIAAVVIIAGIAVRGAWRADPDVQTRSWSADELTVAFGTGHVEDGALVIDTTQQNLAVIAIPVESFAAEDYPHLEFEGTLGGIDASVLLAWNGPDPARTAGLNHTGAFSGMVRLGAEKAWTGEITRLELIIGGRDAPGTRVTGVLLRGASAGASLRYAAAAVTRVFGEAKTLSSQDFASARRPRHLPIVPLMVVASVLGLGIYVILCRLAGRPMRRSAVVRAGVAFFLAAWILLDLRWQWELGVHAGRAVATYAGRPWLERYDAMGSGDVARFLAEAEHYLPDGPAWIIFSSGDIRRTRRGPHFLYPRNAISELPPPSEFQAGDLVVLFKHPTVHYRAAEQALEWSETGDRLPVRLLWESVDGGVFQVVRE